MDIVPLLKKHNIPLDKWGKGEAKTIAHLQKEVDAAEARLYENTDGILIREISVLALDVLYRRNKDSHRLREDRQVFKDGRVRQRSHLTTSLGEKLYAHEARDADLVLRTLNEELGTEDNLFLGYESLHWKEIKREQSESQSYPGLNTEYVFYPCEVALLPVNYRDSYVEHQDDKSTYFKWQKA